MILIVVHIKNPFYVNDTAFLYMTYGNRPLIMLLQDGAPVETYHYRNIKEDEIADFLGK